MDLPEEIFVDAGNLKKGPWTSAEDAILVSYVSKHGEGNWNSVQKHSGLFRCGKSCRLRWANHLRPNLKKGAFSPDEERDIVELHSKFGKLILHIIVTSVLVAPMSCAKKTFLLHSSFSFQGMTIIWFKAVANAFQVYVSSTWFPHVS
jgi:hypothetical protein